MRTKITCYVIYSVLAVTYMCGICSQTFMAFVGDARKAAVWLQANEHLLKASVQEPWAVLASDEEIKAFLQSYTDTHGVFTYEDTRDRLLFNFNDEDDLRLFWSYTTRADILCNVCLFGSSYLANNTDFS